MSKLLYSIKMILVSGIIIRDLPKGAVFGVGQLEKLLRFVKFAVTTYVPWWIEAPIVPAAPINDLSLLNDIACYIRVDKKFLME